MRNARDHGFLWRIGKDGRTSYLYGTLHVATLDLVWPGVTVRRAVTASDRIALELDLLDGDIARRLQAAIRVGSDVQLPAKLAERLRRQAERACVPMADLDRMFPEMRVATLATLIGRGDGLYPDYAIDLFFASWARGLKKPVTSLETPELQMEMLRSKSAKERDAALGKELDDLEAVESSRAMLRRIVDMWAGSRLDELQRYMEWCACVETELERRQWRRAFDDRNPGLAKGIDSLHESGQTVFAAVGALHMIGPTGLPALLAARGFEVEFIAFTR